MRILHADALAALDSGRFIVRNLIHAELPGGTIGFWDDIYDLVYAGVTYTRGAGAFTMSPISSHGDLAVRGVQVVFSSLDTDVVSQIYAAEYHQRSVVISRAIMAADQPFVIQMHAWFAGFIDQAVIRERGGGTADLTIRCETIARELNRKGARTRSNADQRQIDVNDGFFQHTANATNSPIRWGRRPDRPRSLGSLVNTNV